MDRDNFVLSKALLTPRLSVTADGTGLGPLPQVLEGHLQDGHPVLPLPPPLSASWACVTGWAQNIAWQTSGL